MQPVEAPGFVRQRLRIKGLPAPARIDLADKAAQVKPLRLLHRHAQRGRPVLFPRGKIVQFSLRHGVGRRVIAQRMQPAGQRCRCPALGQGEKSERRAEQQAARKQQGRRPSPVRAEQQQSRQAARQKQQTPARREQPNGAADRRKRQRNGRKPYAPAPGAAAGGQRRKKAERQEGPEALPHSARRCQIDVPGPRRQPAAHAVRQLPQARRDGHKGAQAEQRRRAAERRRQPRPLRQERKPGPQQQAEQQGRPRRQHGEGPRQQRQRPRSAQAAAQRGRPRRQSLPPGRGTFQLKTVRSFHAQSSSCCSAAA